MSIGQSISKHFLVLISISLIISIPVIFYTMNEWLADFSYRVKVTPIEFVSGALLVLFISFGAVAVHVFKAARANPIDALRHD